MKFKSVIETEAGGVEFVAEFDSEDVKFLISYAVTNLMRQGAIPFTTKDMAFVQPTTGVAH